MHQLSKKTDAFRLSRRALITWAPGAGLAPLLCCLVKPPAKDGEGGASWGELNFGDSNPPRRFPVFT